MHLRRYIGMENSSAQHTLYFANYLRIRISNPSLGLWFRFFHSVSYFVKHLKNSNSPPCFQLDSPQWWAEWDWDEICDDRTRRDPLGWWKEGLLGKFYHYLSSLFVYFPATVYLFSFFFSSFEVVSILLSMIKKIRAGAFCSVLNRLNRPKLI